MIKPLINYKYLITFGVPLFLFSALVFIINAPLFQTANNSFIVALSLDFLITVPFIYLGLIWRTDIPKTTVVPMMILGLIIGSLSLPIEHQTYLNSFKTWALPIIEIGILSTVIFKMRKAIKKSKSLQNQTLDFFSLVKQSCKDVIPNIMIHPFATEIAVFYYGFIHWKTIPLKDNEFTYHKKSGSPALLGALMFIIIIESISLHLVFSLWNEWVAWGFTALSIYSGIQLFGFAKSLSKRPIAIEQNSLSLNYGILSETTIPLNSIAKIELTKKALKEKEPIIKLSPLGDLESHNTIIHLNSEQTLIGFYGIKKTYTAIALFIDKPQEFKENMEMKIRPPSAFGPLAS